MVRVHGDALTWSSKERGGGLGFPPYPRLRCAAPKPRMPRQRRDLHRAPARALPAPALGPPALRRQQLVRSRRGLRDGGGAPHPGQLHRRGNHQYARQGVAQAPGRAELGNLAQVVKQAAQPSRERRLGAAHRQPQKASSASPAPSGRSPPRPSPTPKQQPKTRCEPSRGLSPSWVLRPPN